MAVSVGTLTIDLRANTASFSQSMDKMSQLSAKTANDVKRSLDRVAVAGIGMATALAGGTVALVSSTFNAVDKMGKMAQAAGTTSETLSTLSYAAGLASVSNATLANGLEKLSLSAFKAQNGGIALANVFRRIGVTTTDSTGHLKDSGILMEQIAVKFATMRDSAGKTALAMALFGRGGAQLIPFLNQYGAEQARVNEEAHRFGLVLGTSTVEVAMKAHDNLDRLSMVMKGMGFSLLSATLPALDELLQKLIDISQTADLQGLAKSFGGTVTTAIHVLGDTLDFAVKHAHALKIALEALAVSQVAKIGIPIIADLAGGKLAAAGKGIDKFTIGLFGMEKALPAASKLGKMIGDLGTKIKDEAQFTALLAKEEGLAYAAGNVFGDGLWAIKAALASTLGMMGVITVGIGAFVVALISEKNAAESLAGKAVTWGDLWHAAFENIKDDARALLDLLSGNIPKALDDLTGFKSLRERAAEEAKSRPEPIHYTGGYETGGDRKGKPSPDTSGLGKPEKDPYGEEIKKLDLAIASQKAYLAVLDATPDKIQAVASAEKARAVILELNKKLHDEGRAALSAYQEATLLEKVSTEEALKALTEYGKELVDQQHSAALSIQQTKALALANLQGEDAIRKATVANAILGLTYNRTTEQLAKMAPEIDKVRAALTAKGNIELVANSNKEIDSLRDQLDERRLLTAATLESIDARRQAELAAKTSKLNDQIAATDDPAGQRALMQKRDAILALTAAENQAADAQSALSLRSPIELYRQEMDALEHATDALAQLQNGTLTYAQQLGIAARQQDEFNKLTDQTVALLLQQGTATQGITAFFLEMEKQAKTTGAIVYEALHDAFDKIADNLTDLITTGKANFGKMFQDIGKQMLNSEIKQAMQQGLGKLGDALHMTLGGATGKPDGSSQANALWVRAANSFAQASDLRDSRTGAVNIPGAPVPVAPGNELTRIGAVPAEAPRTVLPVTPPASVVSNELTRLIGAPPETPATPETPLNTPLPSSDTRPLRGESLGLPTMVPFAPSATEVPQAVSALNGIAQQPNAGGVVGALVSLFGGYLRHRAAAATEGQQGPLPAVLNAPNELAGIAPSVARPLEGNELDNLIHPVPVGQSVPVPAQNTPSQQHVSILGMLGGLASGILGSALKRKNPDQDSGSEMAQMQPLAGNELDALINPVPAGESVPSGTAEERRETRELASFPLSSGPGRSQEPQRDHSGIFGMLSGLASGIVGSALKRKDADTDLAQIQPLEGNELDALVNPVPVGQSVPVPQQHKAQKDSGIFGMLGTLGAGLLSSLLKSKGGDDSDSGGELSDLFSSFSGFSEGGKVSGAGSGTSDSIPAKLSHGEFVVRAAPAAKNIALLQRINQGRDVYKVPGFALGGMVASPSAAYTAGEQSAPSMAMASDRIAGAAGMRRQDKSGPNISYTIDARGTDPVLMEQRFKQALFAVHGSAATKGVQGSIEYQKRIPQR